MECCKTALVPLRSPPKCDILRRMLRHLKAPSTRHHAAARRFPVFRLVLLAVLASTSFAFQGDKVWYQAETTVSMIQGTDGRPVANMSASAGTIINYDGSGKPNFIGFAEAPQGTVQGEYGTALTGGEPKNKGRIIYKQANPNEAMPYSVIGEKDIYMYHLKYLEVTTVGKGQSFGAYATKAVAFDNKVEMLSGATTYKLPEGGQLDIENGKIKFGDNYISPNYDLSGKLSVSQARLWWWAIPAVALLCAVLWLTPARRMFPFLHSKAVLLLIFTIVLVNCSRQKTTDNVQSTQTSQAAKPTTGKAGTRQNPQVDELTDAATKGDLVLVRALLAAGVDVNAPDKYGSVALIGASAQGHLEVVRALLAAGADVNAKSRGNDIIPLGGQTALMAAVVDGNEGPKPEVVRTLLAAGADVKAKEGSETALTIASQYGSPEVVRLLVAAGATQPPHAVPENSGRVYYSDGKGSKTCMTTVCDPNCRMVSVPCN